MRNSDRVRQAPRASLPSEDGRAAARGFLATGAFATGDAPMVAAAFHGAAGRRDRAQS
jgi:hypothetical protein